MVLVLNETASLERDITVNVVNSTVDGSANEATYNLCILHCSC